MVKEAADAVSKPLSSFYNERPATYHVVYGGRFFV